MKKQKKSFNIQDDDIDIEEEIDLDDPVMANDDELSGTALLHATYLTNSDEDKDQQDDDEGEMKITL
jgi:hypothetical protein